MRESSIRGPRRETPPHQVARAFPLSASDGIYGWERRRSGSNGCVDCSLSPELQRGLPRRAAGEEGRNAPSSPSIPKAEPTKTNRDDSAAAFPVGRDGDTRRGSKSTSSGGDSRTRGSETRVVDQDEDTPRKHKGAAVTGDRNAGIQGVLKDSSPSQSKTDRWSALEVSIPRLENAFSSDRVSASDRSSKSPPPRGGCEKRSISPSASSESRNCSGGEKLGFRDDQTTEARPSTLAEKSKVSRGGGGGVEDDGCADINRSPDRRSGPDGTKELRHIHRQAVDIGEKSLCLSGGKVAPNAKQSLVSSQRPPDREDDEQESTAGSGEENYVDPLPRHASIGGISGDGRFVVRTSQDTEARVGDASSAGKWPVAGLEMAVATAGRTVASPGGLLAGHQARPSVDRRDMSKSESMVTVQVDSTGGVTYVLTPDTPRRGKWSRLEEEYAKKIIHDFDAGLLDAEAGTGLRQLLASKLQCEVMRVSKKFCGWASVGKRSFRPVPNLNGDATRAQASLHALEQRWLKTFVPSNGVARLTLSASSSPSSSGSSPAASLARRVPAPPLVECDTGPVANLHRQAAGPTTLAVQWRARADDDVSRGCSSKVVDSRLNIEGRRHSGLKSGREAAVDTAAAAGADARLRNRESWARGEEQQVHRSAPNVDATERDGDSAIPSTRCGSASDGLASRSGGGQAQQPWPAEHTGERRVTRDEWGRRPRHNSNSPSWMRGDDRGDRESADGGKTASGGHSPGWHMQRPDPAGAFQHRTSPPPASSKEWSSTPGPTTWHNRNEHGTNSVSEQSNRVHGECDGHDERIAQPYPIYSRYGKYHTGDANKLRVETGAETPSFSPSGSSFHGNEQQHVHKRTFSSFTIPQREGDEDRGGQAHGGWHPSYMGGSQSTHGQQAGLVMRYPSYAGTPLTRSAPRREYPPMGYQIDRDVGYSLRGQGHSDNHDSSSSSSVNHSPGLRSLGGMSSFQRKHLPRLAHLRDDDNNSSSEIFPGDSRRVAAAEAASTTSAPAADCGPKTLLERGGRAGVRVEEHEKARVGGWSGGRQEYPKKPGRYYSVTGDDGRVLPGNGASGYHEAMERRRHSNIEVRRPVRGGAGSIFPDDGGDKYRTAERRRYSDNAVMGCRLSNAERTPLIPSISGRRWAEEAAGLTRELNWEVNGKRRRPEGSGEDARGDTPRVGYVRARAGSDPDKLARGHFAGSFVRGEVVGRSEGQVDWRVDGGGHSTENGGGCDVEGGRDPTGDQS